jgi:hypothetical protein
MTLAALKVLPAVARVELRGADATLLTTHARATLEALFSADPSLVDLEVTSASLEDALADIISSTGQEAA